MIRYSAFLLLLALATGCRMVSPTPSDPLASLPTDNGAVIWQGEYAFIPPEPPWRLLELDEEDYSIGFYRGCNDGSPGNHPCESTFAYGEEPFGYSRDLHKRQQEFFRRFLWAARVDFDEPNVRPVRALGREALEVDTIGHERVLEHKVLVKVVFAQRGERIVAFYFTQWRPAEEDFDHEQLQAFEDFVSSFEFLRPSFYERLNAVKQ